ncbi:septum site-determining protein Ssd [Nocardioides pantholopis]|uniref:septum site-determining protein Ssd n=1 Tax=Nocardioides pantholopis TaxID=2483798 RepID=UPI000F091647|nr:septum site-determining protein Ssd [Nocardioides pantholopis]
MRTPLLITADESLLDELLRLAAAAGVTPDVAHDAAAALRGWAAAPLVLLGADLAAPVARLAPGRRPGVHVVAWGESPDELFRLALAVGAENVAELPRSDGWLTDLLTDLGDSGRARGFTVGVLGGSGGAGATTFACALGQVAARSGPAVVIDADPLGPGVDRVLGLEGEEGVRWDALCQTTGRLGARSLRDALPRRGDLGALTWYAGASEPLPADAVREVLSAAQRGHDVVVVDLPRAADPVVEEVTARCDLVLVVVTPGLAGLASAARLCARLPDRSGVRLVVRGPAPDPREVARLTGVGVLVTMADQRGLAESIGLGLGPVRSRRGPLARAVGEVLARVAVSRAAA